jgi:hypothetical protein
MKRQVSLAACAGVHTMQHAGVVPSSLCVSRL